MIPNQNQINVSVGTKQKMPPSVVQKDVNSKKLKASSETKVVRNEESNLLKQQQQQKENPKSQNSKEHAKMLEAFWKLSEFNQNTRLDGIHQIINFFRHINPIANKENYIYVLNRLIKGLASNRKCSRLGFSCCLTELLNLDGPVRVNMHELISLAKSFLSATKTDITLTKEEMRHMHIGFVFVYLCWMQSSRLTDKSTETAGLILQAVNDLNSMRKKPDIKFYIQELYLQALILLVKKLENVDQFKSLVLSSLSSDFADIWSFNADNVREQNTSTIQSFKSNLNLLLACLNKNNELTCKILKEENNLKLKSLFNAKNFDLFYDILSQSSESLPKLQPICLELIEHLVRQDVLFFKQLWSDLINAKLCLKKDQEKKIVCFKLYLFALSLVNVENVQALFQEILLESSHNVLQSFSTNYAYKTTKLNRLCRTELARELSEIVKSKETDLADIGSSTLAADLCMQVIRYTKNLHDISDLVGSFIMCMNKHSLNQLFRFLINDLLKPDLESLKAKDDGEDERQVKLENLMSKQVEFLKVKLVKNKSCIISKNKNIDLACESAGKLCTKQINIRRDQLAETHATILISERLL